MLNRFTQPLYEHIARTLMGVGRELRPAQGEGDFANSILYRKDDTLYVIDTRHYMSRLDFELADHYEAALRGAFERVSGYIAGFDDPAKQAHELFGLFKPLDQSASTRRPIESLPTQPVQIGKLRMQGWVLRRNDVVLLHTAGHTDGQLIAFFPEASAANTRLAFTRGLDAAQGGAVQILTDGHTFSLYRGEAAVRARLQSYLNGYDTCDRVVRGLLKSAPSGLTVKQLVDRIGRSAELARAPGGANPGGQFFGALQVVTKLEQLHAVSTGGTRSTQRFTLPHV